MLLALLFAITLRDAQQLLYSHHYAAARDAYAEILKSQPKNVDARKGLATAEYWAGDFRSARRDFEAVLRARPSDAEARKAVSEIDAASAPVANADANITSDDQPMRRSVVSASYTGFTDPLTKWTASAGTYQLAAESKGFGSATAPFAGVGASTSFPWQHVRAGGSFRLFRFPDRHNQLLGGASVSREWAHSALTLAIDKHELLYTASSIRDHPNETSTSINWTRTTDANASNAALRDVRYFDHNRGIAAEAYHLLRVAHNASSSLSAGGAISYRDTNESRFINGIYDPYWTPRKLTDARCILAAAIGVRNAAIHLHADAGVAHDADLAQTFHPWRASADFDLPLRNGTHLTAGVERQSTVFYRATTFHIGVSGHP